MTTAEPAGTTSATSASTRAVERALSLLATVCTHEVISLASASRRTGVPASTALRLLRTLERENFVLRDDDASWRAGPRLLQLAVRSLAREPLARLARPVLTRLAAVTGESAYLSMRGADGIAVHVAAAEGTHPIRYAAWVGHMMSVTGTAVGDALEDRVGPHGFAAGPPSTEPDVTQVAAPIRRPGGVVAALSVIGPAYRMDRASVSRLGQAVVAEARSLEAAMGDVTEPSPPRGELSTDRAADRANDRANDRPTERATEQERAVAG
jgi:urocanate hydratase